MPKMLNETSFLAAPTCKNPKCPSTLKKKVIAKLYYVCMKEYSTTFKNMNEP